MHSPVDWRAVRPITLDEARDRLGRDLGVDPNLRGWSVADVQWILRERRRGRAEVAEGLRSGVPLACDVCGHRPCACLMRGRRTVLAWRAAMFAGVLFLLAYLIGRW